MLRQGVTRESMWEAKKNWVPLMRQDEVIEYPADQSTLTQRCTEEALQFVRSNRDLPFFLYLPHTMPHIPLYASPQFEGKSEISLYGDCIEEIDWSVGQIADELRRLGLAENTLSIYTSDNGPWDMRAMPAVMWWRRPFRRAKLPTQKIDGTSLLPLILGEANPPEHPPYFYRTEAVRVGKWKGFWKKKEERFLLFDLSVDVAESNNVAEQHPEVVEMLRSLLSAHALELSQPHHRSRQSDGL
jgi:arylsulfatase A